MTCTVGIPVKVNCDSSGKPNRVPIDDKNCSPSHRNGVRLQTGILFGITTECCSASAPESRSLTTGLPTLWPLSGAKGIGEHFPFQPVVDTKQVRELKCPSSRRRVNTDLGTQGQVPERHHCQP